MATLAYQKINIPGTQVTYSAAAGGGDSIPVNDRGFLHVKNGGGSPITVTLATPGTDRFGSAIPDVAVTVANATDKMIGPIISDFSDPTDGTCKVTYSGVTSVTVAAVNI